MKTRLIWLIILCAGMTFPMEKAWGSHIVGAELTYSCVNACTVRIEFRGYRHCSGVAVVSPGPTTLVPASPNCGQPTDLGPWSPEFQTEVVPLCAAFFPTNCTDPNSPISGIMEHYSFRDYDICSQPNCLYTIEWATCCRNGAITTGSANEGLYVGATTLNTALTPCNNSPQFTQDPFFYICAGRPTLASVGATDPDGDSLAYSLGPCSSGANGLSSYAAGFSFNQPLGPTWTVSINPVTGDMLLVPNPGNIEVGIICVYVEEYRNGVLINTLVRDMQVSVLPCPPSLVCQAFNVVEGNLYEDDNANCTKDLGESSFVGTGVVMSNPGGYLVPVAPNGDYRFYLPQGNFDLEPVPPGNGYWETVCPLSGSHSVSFPGIGDTLSGKDFAVDVLVDCPEMWVSLGMGMLRPCMDVNMVVAYANNGTDTAYGATVVLTLDTHITYLSSGIPVASTSGNLYTFSLGDVAPGQTGTFSVLGNLWCSTAISGWELCNEVHIYPDSLCEPLDSLWDNSSLTIQGHCPGDSTGCFTVTNTGPVGAGDMQGPSNWRLFQQGALVATGTLTLCGGCDTTICLPGTGYEMFFEVDQRPGHPGNSQPRAFLQGCGDPNWAGTWQGAFPADDGNSFVDVDCGTVVNSYDPNSKRVSPSGIDPQYHYVDSTAILEYYLDFQNTGTAYAIEVVIEDTLDPRLDLTTLVPGASSHNYTWEVASDRRLRFVFSNINLPTETQDSLGSIGFVKFYIQMLPGVVTGDRIENAADIYFDINAPIRTNTVFNTVGWPVLTSTDIGSATSDIRLFPNPAKDKIYIEALGPKAGTLLNLELYSLLGRKVFSGVFVAGSRFQMDLGSMPSGAYLYRVLEGGTLLGAGKLVKH